MDFLKACRDGNTEMVQFLIDNGEKPNNDALSAACCNGKNNIAEILLSFDDSENIDPCMNGYELFNTIGLEGFDKDLFYAFVSHPKFVIPCEKMNPNARKIYDLLLFAFINHPRFYHEPTQLPIRMQKNMIINKLTSNSFPLAFH